MKKIITLYILSFSLSALSAERIIDTFCRGTPFSWSAKKELVLGSEGKKFLEKGWVIPLLEANTEDECKRLSNNFNNSLKPIKYQTFCKASFICKTNKDGNEELILLKNKSEIKLINFSKTNQYCTSVVYSLEQKLRDRCR